VTLLHKSSHFQPALAECKHNPAIKCRLCHNTNDVTCTPGHENAPQLAEVCSG